MGKRGPKQGQGGRPQKDDNPVSEIQRLRVRLSKATGKGDTVKVSELTKLIEEKKKEAESYATLMNILIPHMQRSGFPAENKQQLIELLKAKQYVKARNYILQVQHTKGMAIVAEKQKRLQNILNSGISIIEKIRRIVTIGEQPEFDILTIERAVLPLLSQLETSKTNGYQIIEVEHSPVQVTVKQETEVKKNG